MSGFANFNAAFPTGPQAQGGRTIPQRSGAPLSLAPGAPLPGQTASQLGLKATEKAYFDSLFFSCEGSRAGPGGSPGTVSGAAIKALFTSSRLPKASLVQVWTLSDRQRRKVLDQEDFYIACRLIAIAQQNLPVTYQSLKAYTELPLPQFEGIPMPQQQQQQQMPQAMPGMQMAQAPGGMPMMPQGQFMPQQQQQQQAARRNVAPMTTAGPGLHNSAAALGSLGPALGQGPNRGMDLMGAGVGGPAGATTGGASFPVSLGRSSPGGSVAAATAAAPLSDPEWSISDVERAQYLSLFSQADADGDGFVGGKEANLFFKQSGLDNATLKQIWLLSDVDRDNRLNPAEFAIAMHLTLRVRKKQPLPPTLPPAMDPRNAQQQQHANGSHVQIKQAPAPMQSPGLNATPGLLPSLGASAPPKTGGKLNLDFAADMLPSPAQSAAPPQLVPAPQASDFGSFDAGFGSAMSGGAGGGSSGAVSARSSRPSSRRASTVVDDFGFGGPSTGSQQQLQPTTTPQQQQPSFANFNGLTLNTGVTPVSQQPHQQAPLSLGGAGGFGPGSSGGEPKYAMIEATQALEDRTSHLHSLTSSTEAARRAGGQADSRLEAKLKEVAEVNAQIAEQEKLLEEQRKHVAGLEEQHAAAEQQLIDARKRLSDAQELLRSGDGRAKSLAESTAAAKREASELDMQVTLLDSQLQSLRSSLKGVEDLKDTQANIVQARRDQQARLLHEKAQLTELLNASKRELAQLKEEASIIKGGLQAQQEAVDETHQLLQEHQAIVREERLKPSPKSTTANFASPPAATAVAPKSATTAVSPAGSDAGIAKSPAALVQHSSTPPAAVTAPVVSASAQAKAKAAFSFGDDDAYNLDDIQLPTLGSAPVATAPAAAAPPAASPAASPPAPAPAPAFSQSRVAAARASFDAKMHEEWSKPIVEPEVAPVSAAASKEAAKEASPAAADAATADTGASNKGPGHISTSSVAFQSQSDVFGTEAAPSSLHLTSPQAHVTSPPLSASSMASPPAPAVPSFPSALQGTGVPDAFGESSGFDDLGGGGGDSGNPWDDDIVAAAGSEDPFGAPPTSTTSGTGAASATHAAQSPSAKQLFGEDVSSPAPDDPFGFAPPAEGGAGLGTDPFGDPEPQAAAAASPGAATSPPAGAAASTAAPASTIDAFGAFDDFGADFGQTPPPAAAAPAAAPTAASPAATTATPSPGAASEATVPAAATVATSPPPPVAAPAPAAAASPQDKKAAITASFEAAMADDWAAFE